MKRRTFIQQGLLAVGALHTMNLRTFANEFTNWEDSDQVMPVLFVGHGAPMYALGDNKYTLAWRKLGEELPKPRAIVSISAHWLTPGRTQVTAAPKPRTIHDFGGMDSRLYEMQYPAPGSPELANEIALTIEHPQIATETDWGFDHGTWCVLYHMYPKADIPVIQLSIDYKQHAAWHMELGKELQFLRKKGVLVVCSGNIVHNLRVLKFQESAVYDWAAEFDAQAKELIDKGNYGSLINYQSLGRAAELSIPTPDHYFPLMYALGLKTAKDTITYPVEGMAYGSTSMRSVLITPS
ncbi:MAG: 4,5-DOPA dioxygenase extradiol [Flavobacteriales bacterium]|nr:4,5-DOPA dioxygenase extradiol [Flavobacteriales bacterium]